LSGAIATFGRVRRIDSGHVEHVLLKGLLPQSVGIFTPTGDPILFECVLDLVKLFFGFHPRVVLTDGETLLAPQSVVIDRRTYQINVVFRAIGVAFWRHDLGGVNRPILVNVAEWLIRHAAPFHSSAPGW
jgi:hypothetical protein